MKFFTKVIIVCALFTLTGATLKPTNNIYISNFENILGTSLEIKVHAVSQADADFAEDAALNEIDRLSNILSIYDPKSEFSNFIKSSATPQKLSPELFEVLSLFDDWRLRTQGALDASAEVISRVWRNAAAKQQLPSALELDQAVATVKQKHYSLDSMTQTAVHLDNAPLILNSFTKSYIVNKAAEMASKSANVSAVVVNIGGDIVIRGAALEEPVRVSNPLADAENDAPLTQLLINNMAVATSGNYRRGVQIRNKWYSHIVDPRTGQPADHIISATVVAPNAADAGALATALNVLSTKESLKLVSSLPNVEALLITRDGKRIETKGWKKLEVPVLRSIKPIVIKKVEPYEKSWNKKYELAINIEIAKIEGARINSPFVAVWVEAENKIPVRNIVVWYNKPKWMHNLKSWHRDYGATLKDTKKMSSVSSATRTAGKYQVKWDGINDDGALVKAGKYTIYIEVSREHGTYQLMSSEMNFDGTAKLINLTGNVEIASASLDYRKKLKK